MEMLGLFLAPSWIVYTLLFFTVAYVYYTWTFGAFAKLGVPGPKPYPVLGNMGVFFKHGFVESERLLIKKYGNIMGYYLGRQPRFVIGDVEILKQILIKDFSTFQNRDVLALRGIVKRSLFDARDDFWRNLRQLLTPGFTTGKLKQMMPLIRICGDRLVENIDEKCRKGEIFEAKQYCGAFTLDVIASTGFGWEIDSQTNKNNTFVCHAKKLLDIDIFNPWVLVMVLTPFLVPLLEAFGISLFPNDSIAFFSSIVNDALKDRRKGIGKRVDFLQIMLEAECHLQEANKETKEELKATVGYPNDKKKAELSEDDIVAQALILLVAGYDTTATTMSFLLYQLAINQQIQDKLFAEILEVIGTREPMHEDLYKLSYMDMCINETLRMYSPVSSMDRMASHNFEYNGVKVPKGTLVVVPIRHLHYDPEGWPDPEKFNPERFTPEAKASRDNMYFLPFGLGPRQCIGMRLALLQLKLALVKLFRKFRIVTCDKTQIPVTYKKTFLMTPEKGIWVKAVARQ